MPSLADVLSGISLGHTASFYASGHRYLREMTELINRLQTAREPQEIVDRLLALRQKVASAIADA